MIFKPLHKSVHLLFILSLATVLSGCTDFLQGKPKKQDFIEVKKENLTCLKSIPNKIKIFFKAEAQKQDVKATFECLDSTLNELQTRAQGTIDANAFSTDDVHKIFDQFVHDAKISVDTTKELMKLKTALLGGSEQKITKTEIVELRGLLKSVEIQVYLLLPFAKIYSFEKADQEFTKTQINDAFKQMESSLNIVVKETRFIKSDYGFEDFKRLILNLNIFNSKSDDILELTTSIRDLIIGNEILRSETDYQLFIGNIVQILRLYSIHTQNYIAFKIQDAAKMNDTVEFIEEGISLLENLVQYKKGMILSSETLDPLIAKMADKKIVPIDVEAETLVQFYKIILVRVFESGIKSDPQSFTGIKKVHFLNMKRELTIFKTYLSSIKNLNFAVTNDTNTNGRIELAEAQKGIRQFDFSRVVNNLIGIDENEKNLILGAVSEYRAEFLSPRPVIYRFNKMVIAANQEVWKQSSQDLVNAVYMKFSARALMLGWGDIGESRLVKDATISESALVKWYADFKQLCIEIKLFDPRSVNSGAKSFKEANLFPYSADGNGQLSFFEAVQYLNILATGGGKIFGEVKQGLANSGCNLAENDAFGFPWNSESCVYNDLKKNYRNYFNNLSYLVGYLDKLNDQQFLGFYESVMTVTRNDASIKGRIESADLRNFIILMHYMESLYAQFDTDRNWTLSDSEIRAAYPRFKIFATDFAYKTAKDKIAIFNSTTVRSLGYGCYKEQDLIRESFVFLIYNGTTPGITDLNIAPCIGKRSLIDFQGEIDRKTIINTFKILKAVLGS